MPALKQRISEEMKAAFLGGDRFRGDVLRNLQAAILNEEVAQGKREAGLEDSGVEKVITREAKKRVESASLYRQNNRIDLAEPEEQELEVLKEYLPEQIGEDELRQIVRSKISELNVSGPQAMGQVIGAIKAEVGSAADGATLARIVREILIQS